MGKLFNKINNPEDLKKLDENRLDYLAKEIREYLVNVVSETGGHLSSNLGVVELTIALHYIFNSPKDKLIWDVGHQSYVHKILTNRKDELKSIRQYNGLSGFPKKSESEHDVFETGHSSTSISAALGLAMARDINKEDNYIVSIIGDGALTGGMAFEALNNAANLKSNFIVILNDNQMSISKNVGGMALYLDSIRTKPAYMEIKEDVQKVLRKIPRFGEDVINAVRDVKDGIKQLFIPGMFFEELGFTYLGPIDGHNIKQLITTFNQAKRLDCPVLIHLKTIKGKGYKHAENNPSKFHGTKPFVSSSGKLKETSTNKSYSKYFGETLVNIAKDNSKVVAITAAMPEGTGLQDFAIKYKKRFFDVGIAEQHAVTFSAGLATSGLKPFVAIYSSFLQRAYDQLLHDICMQKLPVVFAIDRAGIVGQDGETHQGVYDISFLNHMPNMSIMAPKNGLELSMMVRYASDYYDGPIAIRYPRGSEAKNVAELNVNDIVYGKSEIIINEENIAIICVGSTLSIGLDTHNKLKEVGINSSVINARFIKPIDKELIRDLAKSHKVIITMEENSYIGGYGSEVIRFINDEKISAIVKSYGIEDKFIQHGKRNILLDLCGLNSEKICEEISNIIKDL